jgi:DNA polymerase-3 subunit delta'
MRFFRFGRETMDKLLDAIEHGRLFHAYIIEGDAISGKYEYAKSAAMAILCREEPGKGCGRCSICQKVAHENHEDVYHICADENSLKDATVAELQENLRHKPTAGDYSVAIIEDADTMTVRAQNRLLKTLEEPNPGTVIFLLSENSDNLLPTIRSRCVTVRTAPEFDADNPYVEFAAFLLEETERGAYFATIRDALDKRIKDRKSALAFLDAAEILLMRYFTGQEKSMWSRDHIKEIVSYAEEARRDINFNVNYKYALRNLLIKAGM